MSSTKTVYQTDPTTHIYLFPAEVSELAFAPGKFNIPFCAYEDEPPVAPAGHLVRRSDDKTAWATLEDHRTDTLYLVDGGEKYNMGSEATVSGNQESYPGWDVLPAWLTTIAPPPPPETPTTPPAA